VAASESANAREGVRVGRYPVRAWCAVCPVVPSSVPSVLTLVSLERSVVQQGCPNLSENFDLEFVWLVVYFQPVVLVLLLDKGHVFFRRLPP
jgi:hypothetical protein